MDYYLAEIRPFSGNYAPDGWRLCDGSSLPVAGNDALFSLLGTNFGGDGVTTFKLPDLRGRLPIGSGQGTNLTNRPYASTGGSESVTLTVEQTPAHSHAFNVTAAAATRNGPANGLFANPSPSVFYATTPAPNTKPQVLKDDTVTNSAGLNQPHENRMPTLAINYIIAVTGAYPVQP